MTEQTTTTTGHNNPAPEIRHPDQPDRIDEDSSDLPDVARAARRVRAFISEWGDGLITTANARPLYARDLEALRRAGENLADLRTQYDQARDGLSKQRDQLTTENDRIRAELNSCNQERQRLAAELAEANTRVTTLKQMATEAAQVADDIADGKLVNNLGPDRRPPASVPSPRAQEQRQPFDPDARVAGAAVWLADADTDDERAEVIADLMRDWLAAWPEGAVTDPYEVLAGELVRLLRAPDDAVTVLATALDRLGARWHRDLDPESSYLDPHDGKAVAAALSGMAAYWAKQVTVLDHPAVKRAMGHDVTPGQGAPCGRCWACRGQEDTPDAAVVEAAVSAIADLDRTSDADLGRLDAAVRRLLESPACVALSVPAVSIAETAAEDQGPPCSRCGHRAGWHGGGRCAGDLLCCPCTEYVAAEGQPTEQPTFPGDHLVWSTTGPATHVAEQARTALDQMGREFGDRVVWLRAQLASVPTEQPGSAS